MPRRQNERFSAAWTADSVRLPASPSAFARTALLHVQEIGHFRTLPGFFTERRELDSHLIVHTLAGAGHLQYEGRSYTLTEGQTFFIDCMAYQYYAGDPEQPWELLWVHLGGEHVRDYYRQYAAGGSPVVRLPEQARIAEALRELIGLQAAKSFRAELEASRLLTHLLTELLLSSMDRNGPAVKLPGYIEELLAEIEAHYASPFRLDEAAKRHAVSKYHLAKMFKRHTGFSPGEYVINTRMARAMELLKYTERSVAEIAEHVGIRQPSHFINLFRDRAGLTPLAFRRKWQQPSPV